MCRSVKPSRAALIRAAFSFSNLSAHNKNPNPNGFGFSLCLMVTFDTPSNILRHCEEGQRPDVAISYIDGGTGQIC